MKRTYLFLLFPMILIIGTIGFLLTQKSSQEIITSITDSENLGGFDIVPAHPLSIEKLKEGEYSGSELAIEETLTAGSNYKRYIASYQSEGNKIFGLLTIPNGQKPATGWPAIIFNHGYIAPSEYRTTERYVAYVDYFARSGYIVFKSDYRGHGSSEGQANGGYGNNDYTIDVLNALSTIKKYPDTDPARIGMWGHSMGGYITLRAMVVNPDIKAGVIWGGVVGSYSDLIYNWRRGNSPAPSPSALPSGARRWRQQLMETFGSPEQNPTFWNSISANGYLTDISGPLQLHHGESDASVPVEFSRTLEQQMKQVNKPVELFTYPNDDHDITNYFGTAMSRSLKFFDTYVKSKPE